MAETQPGDWVSLPELHKSCLTEKISLEQYRTVMSYPIWNFVQRAIIDTRSYEHGLNSCIVFLQFTEHFRTQLDKKEFESNSIKLYSLVLGMLDRLDRWEEYLEFYDYFRKSCDFCLTYSKRSKETHGKEIEPYIVSEDKNTIYVHFLWGSHHRRDLIARKADKKMAGKGLGNQFHARQSELSAEEVEKRLAWILKTAEYAKRFNEKLKNSKGFG